jgi:hypothetical protein
MRILTLILCAVLVTLITTRVSAATTKADNSSKTRAKMELEAETQVKPVKGGMETCKIVTGYGTAIGKGKTRNEARENARLQCGTSLIDQYFSQRREISDSAKDDLALACVNLECS